MRKRSGRDLVEQSLKRYRPSERWTFLNVRIKGYGVSDATQLWQAISDATDGDGLRSEMTLLKLDLVFPLFYGAALLISLLMTWEMLGQPFGMAWLFVPVVTTIVADWIENGVQIGQLQRFMAGAPLQDGLVRIASYATTAKLLFFALTCVVVLGLAGIVLCRLFRP